MKQLSPRKKSDFEHPRKEEEQEKKNEENEEKRKKRKNEKFKKKKKKKEKMKNNAKNAKSPKIYQVFGLARKILNDFHVFFGMCFPETNNPFWGRFHRKK